MSGRAFRAWRLLPAVAWAAGIWLVSSTPDDGSSWLDLPWLAPLTSLPLLDKLVHAGLFGVLAALLLFARAAPWAAVAIASSLGVLDEIHQGFVPGRMADPWDLLADVVGALAAVTAVRWLAARRRSAGYPGRSKRRSEP